MLEILKATHVAWHNVYINDFGDPCSNLNCGCVYFTLYLDKYNVAIPGPHVSPNIKI